MDNGSNDGTHKYLKGLKIHCDLKVHFQKNLGGAGGFHKGIEIFRKIDAHWAWLMDDDGWPHPNALERLDPEYQGEPQWRNSLVLDDMNPTRLSFGILHNNLHILNRDDAIKCESPLHNCNPFNGTLIHRKLVSAIGLPIKDLFIKGDETEYMSRALRYGYKTRTFPSSFFFHPSHRESNICDVAEKRVWIFYYKVRNIDVFAEPDGSFRFNPNSSFRLAKKLTFTTIKGLINNSITFQGACHRIIVVWSGFFSAFLNIPFLLYVPK